MAEVVQEKSRGLKFAEQQLLRHGWEQGKGLGRAENGISEAIKVKVKCDKGGVGHKEGEQFTFHWWDHVFNKASSSLQVESDQNGITLKKTTEEEDGMISNKKPRKATLAKDKLYGCFVKSATLLSGQEQPEPKASSSDDSSSSDEEDDQRMDLSSTTKLSDTDLMKVCGGRTAHKGARHGVTMSAKLARLEQQEAEFMAKYGKKNQPAPPPASCLETQEETMASRKKMKINELSGDEVCETPETDVQPKKKKKKKKNSADPEERTDEDLIHVENCEADDSHKKKKKKKKHKKKNKVEENGVEETHSPAAESEEVTAEMHADEGKKKKKKKSSKPLKENESDCKESSQSNHTGLEESDVTESTVKKRKKCKKDKTCTDKEAAPPLKRKKKSKD